MSTWATAMPKYNTLARSVDSYKADGTWQVYSAARLRGGYQHAIRVPADSFTFVSTVPTARFSVGFHAKF